MTATPPWEGPGSPSECWCGQPPVVRLDPTPRAGSGWVASDALAPQRFLPVYRCARHLSGPAPGRGYAATILR